MTTLIWRSSVLDTGSMIRSGNAMKNRFSTEEACLNRLQEYCWPNGDAVCPYCRNANTTQLLKESRYHCNRCNTSFSVSVGTFFHKTRVELKKWFLLIGLMRQGDSEPSVRFLAKELAVNKNTAWRMLKRLKTASIDERQWLDELVED